MKKQPQCPICNHVLDADTCVDEKYAKPDPGDVAICIECKNILIYDDNLEKREPTADEINSFREDEVFWNTIQKSIYIAKEVN